MTTFIDFYQDFLQKKESSDSRRASNVSAPEDEPNDSCPTPEVPTENVKKMEHSYNRDAPVKPSPEITTGLPPVRTIVVRKPPQCSSCYMLPSEDHEVNDGNQAIIPSFNEISAKEAMNECSRIAKYVKNVNSDDVDWETRISQNGWHPSQKSLYDKVVKILNSDYLARLANQGKSNEVISRRILIDRSASRLRKVFVSINWEQRLTQWLHALLMDYLPPSYMASYLDILQTLKSKVPTLIDKMLFMRPLHTSQELLAPVMKKQWEPVISTKSRSLGHNVIIVAIPSLPFGSIPRRLQKWYQMLASIAPIIQVTLPSSNSQMLYQPLDQIAELIVSLTRVKIQELRHEDSSRSIILIGFGAGSAFALQVAMSESVAAIVCLGFSYNTINGPRGNPEDRLLDIKAPILFVIGQNSQRTSCEEMEGLRERLQSESSLVVVGSADDFLRVPKSHKRLEYVNQAMVDYMVIDEVYEFMKKILSNPPGPRIPTAFTNLSFTKQGKSLINSEVKISNQRKRKSEATADSETPTKTKFAPNIGRPRTRPMITSNNIANKGKISNITTSPQKIINEDRGITETLDAILEEARTTEAETTNTNTNETTTATDITTKKIITNFELVAQSKSNPIKATLLNTSGTKIRMIPSNQFVQIKPTAVQNSSKYITIKPGIGSNPSSPIGNVVKTAISTTTGQQQIFTLKSPNGQTTQYVTASPASAGTKFKLVKSPTVATTIQLQNLQESNASSNVDLSNIIDMPIVFADKDGNIPESVSTSGSTAHQADTKSNSIGQLIINPNLNRESSLGSNSTEITKTSGTIVFQKSVVGSSPTLINTKQGNKVFYINRNTMKPCTNIITRPNTKFTNVVVTNPKIAGGTTMVPRPGMIISTTSAPTISPINTSIVSSVKPAGIHSIKTGLTTVTRPSSGILNVSTKTLPQVQLINAVPTAVTGANATNITTASDKPQIRNIVLKGGFKQLSPQLSTQLLNRNVTVRKLVNIVPFSRTTNTTTGSLTISQSSLPSSTLMETSPATSPPSSSSPISSIQSSPTKN